MAGHKARHNFGINSKNLMITVEERGVSAA
jgi:hypothetical protein